MNSSTFLIKSNDGNNKSMGTGFVIHQDSFGSYILTCNHVIEQVQTPKLENVEAEVELKYSDEVLDLALLYVKGVFQKPFELQSRHCNSGEVTLYGFSPFSHGEYQGKSREATILGDRLDMVGKRENFIYAKWQVIAKDNHEIEAGNSGGPLICNETGKVIGVMSNNRGTTQGFAVAIEALSELWIDMPPFLIESNSADESPFVGLSAFSIDQSHLFFGRERESKAILNMLKKENLVAVVGDSGSGKSSVIKAGVTPFYLNGALLDKVENTPSFYLIETRPARDPFKELSASILQMSEVFGFDFETVNQLRKAINSKKSEDILYALEYVYKEKGAYLLISIDQFEELFTLCSEEEQSAYVELLLYLLKNQSSQLKIKILFSMRRDYYNLISEYEQFFKLTQKSKYTLRRMKNEQIYECITKPLEKTFISKESIVPFAKAVLQDMGDDASELTLLQIALTQTWKYKNKFKNNLLQTYHEIGEVSGALAKLADNTWKILTPTEQKILQYIFLRIIKSNETGEVTRRLADRDEFSDEAWKLAQRLASALDMQGESTNEKRAQLGRLLKIKGKEGDVLELTHEALVKQWPMYQMWLRKVAHDGLKRTHDYVIEQTKIYLHHNRTLKYCLRGYELDQAEKLLGEEYREYLSSDEIAYIRKSRFYRSIGRGAIVGTFSLVCVLVGLLYFKNLEVERNSAKLLNMTNGVVEYIIKNPSSKRVLDIENKVFSNIVENFSQETKNTKIAQIVAKSWFGKGLVLSEDNKTQQAIKEYDRLINHFYKSEDKIVLKSVVRGWFNKGVLLEQIDENKATHIYFDLLEYLESKRSKELERYKLKVYNALSWLSLLQGDYNSSLDFIVKGFDLDKHNLLLNVNLVHNYLLTNKFKEAKEIYLKYREEMIGQQPFSSVVVSDFKSLEKRGVDSIYFNEIKTMSKDKK